MKLKVVILLIISFTGPLTHAQTKTEDFKITLPESKVANSHYNSISLLDIRNDTTDFGIVQKGAFNKKATVVAKTRLATQFNNVLNALVDNNTAREGEMLLLLRQFSFAEITGAISEKGYCLFRAVLFAKKNDEYRKLETIDTVVEIKAMDVTKKMFRLGSEAVTEFIAGNLTKEPTGDIVLSMEQLPQIDIFEKTKMPLYTATTYTDGLYYNYQSFANQQPDRKEIHVSFDKKKRFAGVSYKNEKGKYTDIEIKYFYTFVYEGKPYISGELTCYPLEKRGDDFYFTGRANDAKNSDVATATFFFGIIGGLIASSATSIFEMKIDHLSGGFIRIKEVGK